MDTDLIFYVSASSSAFDICSGGNTIAFAGPCQLESELDRCIIESDMNKSSLSAFSRSLNLVNAPKY